jgi:monothiol glutaredoxin
MTEINQKIKDLVNSNKIFLFMKGTPQAPECGFSMQVTQILQNLQLEFGSFDVLSDETIRQGVKDYSAWPTIPQLYISGKFVGGCDIVNQLAASGELQKLL